MIYEVLTYGNQVLRREAREVDQVDDDIRRLAKDMLATMYGRNGVGLAAEQIGREESICVIDVAWSGTEGSEEVLKENPDVEMPLVLINPQILEREGEQIEREGCLSFPEIYVPVKRAWRVRVSYRGLDNQPRDVTACGLLSRAIQHEMDHLGGVLLVDHMSPVQKVALAGRLKRLRKQG